MPETICIPYFSTDDFTIEEISRRLASINSFNIDQDSWDSKFDGQAKVEIGYTHSALLIKFKVIEESLKATYTEPNDPVYKDSCVELFISLNEEAKYYNFEFNCKGTCLAGFGNARDDRAPISVKSIKSIEVSSAFKSVIFNNKDMIKWELTVKIPTSAFQFHKIDSLKGKSARLNFYKCGDDLPQPHFLSWKPIKSDTPNFHLNEFFGKAFFE